MLILVGVTVTTAINGGLFNFAKNAAKGTQLERDKEELTLALVLANDEQTGELDINKIKKELGEDWSVVGLNPGPFLCTSPNKNKLTVTTNGEITDEEQLVLSYKIIKTHDEKDDEDSIGLYLMIESGFDYEKTFCDYMKEELESNEEFNSPQEALQYMYKKANDGKEGTAEQIKKMINENFGIKDANYYITPEELVKMNSIAIKDYKNECKVIVESAYNCDRGTSEYIIEEGKVPFTEVTVTIDGKTWKYSLGEEEIANSVKPGDKFTDKDGTEYAVLYNDKKHGLQLVSLSMEKTEVDGRDNLATGSEYSGFNYAVSRLNDFCNDNAYLGKYASARRIVGAHFEEYKYWLDDIGLPDYNRNGIMPADDGYYLEDCEQLKKLGLLTPETGQSAISYILGSRIIKEEKDEGKTKTIYGLRRVSAAGEYGDNIYIELYNSNKETHRENVCIRPVIKINSSYFNSITFDSNIGTYIFK